MRNRFKRVYRNNKRYCPSLDQSQVKTKKEDVSTSFEVENKTVVSGREAILSCHVQHLGSYKVTNYLNGQAYKTKNA